MFTSFDGPISMKHGAQTTSAIEAATQLESVPKRKPIKFVSQINSKPVHPPYIELADFETFVKHQAASKLDQKTAFQASSDKNSDDDQEREDATKKEKHYTYKDLKETLEIMMYDYVYAEKEEFERRKEAERAERELLLRKASRIVKKNKDDEET